MNEMFCQVGVATGMCATCNPGTFRCTGAQLEECRDGVYVMAETCASEALCKADAGACTDMICQPNSQTCAPNGDLRLCSADGSAHAQTTPCGANMCDAVNKRCNKCTPSSVRCEGNSLVRCTADGQNTTTTECTAMGECYTASCRNNMCQNTPKTTGSACGANNACLNGRCVDCVGAEGCDSGEMCDAARNACVQQPCGDGRLDPAIENCEPDGFRAGACDATECRVTDAFLASACAVAPGQQIRDAPPWICNGVGVPSVPCAPRDHNVCRSEGGLGSCLEYGLQITNAAERPWFCAIPCSNASPTGIRGECPMGLLCFEVPFGPNTCGRTPPQP